MIDDTFKEAGVNRLLDYSELDKQLTIDTRDRFAKLDELLDAMESSEKSEKYKKMLQEAGVNRFVDFIKDHPLLKLM